jgi:hypothetical protein
LTQTLRKSIIIQYEQLLNATNIKTNRYIPVLTTSNTYFLKISFSVEYFISQWTLLARDGNEGDEQAMIAVQVWYPTSGNPNGKWTQWRRRHDDNSHSIWIKEIPQHSIAVTDVGFIRKGSTFDKKTKKAICAVPDLQLAYVPKVGIAREHCAIEDLQAHAC